ncbi:MAG: flippase [Candidatus Omnitrophota bacterium]|nr:flippase [Candidatus Omnitrophota bacterium]
MNFSKGFIKYAKNTGYLLVGKIIKLFVTFTVGVCLIRYLGPTQYGLLSYAISFTLLFNVLSDLGLDYIIVRDLVKSKGENERNEMLISAFLLKLLGAVLVVVIILIAINVLSFSSYTKVLIFIISLGMLFEPFNVIDLYFQSKVLAKFIVYPQIFSLAIASSLNLLFIYLKLPLIYLACIVILETIITGIGLYISFKLNKQKIFVLKWRVILAKMRQLLRDSWPLIISCIAISIYMHIDQVMIKAMLNTAEVGYYAVAVKICEIFYTIPMILTASLFPAIINAKLKDKELYYDRLQKLFRFLFWTAVAISISITIAAKPMINILYGHEFSAAAKVLSIYIWASVFIFLGVASGKWVINENLQVYIMFYTIIGAVVNVILNLLLIPAMGINGAAIAAVISQLISAVFCNLLNKKTRIIFLLQMKSFNAITAWRLCRKYIFESST